MTETMLYCQCFKASLTHSFQDAVPLLWSDISLCYYKCKFFKNITSVNILLKKCFA